MEFLRSKCLVAACLAIVTSTALAETVTVRVRKEPRPEYATIETDRRTTEWAVDFLRADGTVWGTDDDTDRAELERRIAEKQELELQAHGGDLSRLRETYQRPSPIYSRTASKGLARGSDVAERKIRKAQQEVMERMRAHIHSLDTFRKAARALDHPRIRALVAASSSLVLDYDLLLGEAGRKVMRLRAQLLDGVTPAELGEAPFDVGQDSIESMLRRLEETEPAYHWDRESLSGWTRGGKREGPWVRVRADGSVDEENYRSGVFHGYVRRWDATGRKIAEGRFDNGTGVMRYWDGNGVLRREESYVDGVLKGSPRVWDEDGRMVVDEPRRPRAQPPADTPRRSQGRGPVNAGTARE